MKAEEGTVRIQGRMRSRKGVQMQNKEERGDGIKIRKGGGKAEERSEDRVKKEQQKKADVDERGKETEERTAQEESRRI